MEEIYQYQNIWKDQEMKYRINASVLILSDKKGNYSKNIIELAGVFSLKFGQAN